MKIIFKTDFATHFPFCFLLLASTAKEVNKTAHITKIIITNDTIIGFKQELYKTSWDDIENNKNPDEAHSIFQERIIVIAK